MEKWKRTLKANIRQYTMILAMLAIWLYFQVTTGGIFMMSRNLNNLFYRCVTLGFVRAEWC